MGCQVRVIGPGTATGKRLARECVDGVDVERVFVSSTHGAWRDSDRLLHLGLCPDAYTGPENTLRRLHCHDLDTLPIGFLLGG